MAQPIATPHQGNKSGNLNLSLGILPFFLLAKCRENKQKKVRKTALISRFCLCRGRSYALPYGLMPYRDGTITPQIALLQHYVGVVRLSLRGGYRSPWGAITLYGSIAEMVLPFAVS